MKYLCQFLQSKYRWVNFLIFEHRKELFCYYVSCKEDNNYDYVLDVALNEQERLDPDTNVIIQKFNFTEIFATRELILNFQYYITKEFNKHEQYKTRMFKSFLVKELF